MDIDLEQLRKAALAATPGLWIVGDIPMPEIAPGELWSAVGKSFDSNIVYAATGRASDEQSARDAAFIAAANPAALLELIKRVEEAEQRAGEMEQRYDRITLALAQKQQAVSELLASLIELSKVDYGHWTDEDIEYEISVGNGMAPLIMRARAAIAKATGSAA